MLRYIAEVPPDTHVLFVQETKASAEEGKLLTDKLYELGWHCYLTAALTGPEGGASAGVGVLIRKGTRRYP